MIGIMALRQSYKRREISEIRWIYGKDNPADAMTRARFKHVLQEFVETNRLRTRVEGFVDRPMCDEGKDFPLLRYLASPREKTASFGTV